MIRPCLPLRVRPPRIPNIGVGLCDICLSPPVRPGPRFSGPGDERERTKGVSVKKISVPLLLMILRACTEAVELMVKGDQDEEVIPSEAAAFLCLLLEKHPEPLVGKFCLHELDALK